MPKEITYSDQPEYALTEDGTEVTPSEGMRPALRRGLSVGWSRDMFVEIGFGPFSTTTSTPHLTQAMYATFDRNGLNRIIRALRKARDQAYGTDA